MGTLVTEYNNWLDEVNARKPPRFPQIFLQAHRRRYPSGLPLDLEQNILCVETMDNVLKDSEVDARWWTPLRQNSPLVRAPRQLIVHSWADRLDVCHRF